MALATVIAGGYTATYNSAAMGQQEDGFRLRMSFAKEEIRSNTYGDAVIDSVYRGGNCFLSGVFIERDSVLTNNSAAPFNPYNGGAGMGFMGVVGRLDFALAKVIVMTAIATLPAASSIATLTGTYSIIDQNLPTEVSMANRASFLPLTFRLYPYLDSGNVKWFVAT